MCASAKKWASIPFTRTMAIGSCCFRPNARFVRPLVSPFRIVRMTLDKGSLSVVSRCFWGVDTTGVWRFIRDTGAAIAPARQSHEPALRRCDRSVRLTGSEIEYVYDRASDVLLPSKNCHVIANCNCLILDSIGKGSSAAPKPIACHRHNPKRSRLLHVPSRSKATVVRRIAISQPSKAASDAESCQLKAFGRLRKALNSDDCEI